MASFPLGEFPLRLGTMALEVRYERSSLCMPDKDSLHFHKKLLERTTTNFNIHGSIYHRQICAKLWHLLTGTFYLVHVLEIPMARQLAQMIGQRYKHIKVSKIVYTVNTRTARFPQINSLPLPDFYARNLEFEIKKIENFQI